MIFKKRKKAKRFILIGYRQPSIKLYTPKRNKFKLFLLGAFVLGCLVTPATDWLIFVLGKTLNPMWIYK